MNCKYYPAELTPEQLAANARIQAETRRFIEENRVREEKEVGELLALVLQTVMLFV